MSIDRIDLKQADGLRAEVMRSARNGLSFSCAWTPEGKLLVPSFDVSIPEIGSRYFRLHDLLRKYRELGGQNMTDVVGYMLATKGDFETTIVGEGYDNWLVRVSRQTGYHKVAVMGGEVVRAVVVDQGIWRPMRPLDLQSMMYVVREPLPRRQIVRRTLR